MKQVCLLCERTSADHNLYCQDVRCPSEASPLVLEHGELLGDIEIVKALVIQRSATVYVAQRAGTSVYLKVSHPGQHHIERLKREAKLLNELRSERLLGDHLPTLLPPTFDSSLEKRSYAKIVLGRHLLYYYVFDYTPAEPLSAILKKTPQLWIAYVGQIALGMGHALTILQSKGYLHLALNPASLLVHIDPLLPKPRVLLVDFGIVCDPPSVKQHWYPELVAPAYMVPEVPKNASYASDVYGMGLILYEMLVGESAIPTRQRSDTEILEAVKNKGFVPMIRRADAKSTANIALAAVDTRSIQDARGFTQQLNTLFEHVSSQRIKRRFSLDLVFGVAVLLLGFAFLVAIVLSLNPPLI